MRAIILGLCAVLAFSSCDGDGGGKNGPKDPGDFSLTPITDDPQMALVKKSVTRGEGDQAYTETTEFSYDDNGYLKEINEGYGYATIKKVRFYNSKGLLEKIEATFDDDIANTPSRTWNEKFTYDAQNRLLSLKVEDLSASAKFEFEYEEKGEEINRKNFLFEDEKKIFLSTTSFDKNGLPLRHSSRSRAYLFEAEQICQKNSSSEFDVFNDERATLSSYTSDGRLNATRPLARDGRFNEDKTVYEAELNGVKYRYEFKRLKTAVRGFFLGDVDLKLLEEPFAPLRQANILYGRFFALSEQDYFDWDDRDGNLSENSPFLEASCNLADAAARAAAEEEAAPPAAPAGEPPAQAPAGDQHQAPLCGVLEDISADGNHCIPTVASCAAEQKIYNAAGECEACPANHHVNDNQCLQNIELPPCPDGQHRHMLICVDDECADNQYRNWFGKCVANPCPAGQHPGWFGGCVNN